MHRRSGRAASACHCECISASIGCNVDSSARPCCQAIRVGRGDRQRFNCCTAGCAAVASVIATYLSFEAVSLKMERVWRSGILFPNNGRVVYRGHEVARRRGAGVDDSKGARRDHREEAHAEDLELEAHVVPFP